LKDAPSADQNYLTANHLFWEATKLNDRAGNQLPQAVEKYQEVLPQWRALGDGFGEASTLHMLGFAYGTITQDFLKQAGGSMNQQAKNARPLARKQDLLVRELADEVLVYDLANDEAHCLNETAAFVWMRCDGRNTPRDIAHCSSRK
jgi:hypothetical protein